ncbi:MAG: sugar O-acetyltransferase [Bacteroidia bacterium]|nr:sugar O-acetyltransferase [Bacteroidia bacterium]
MTEKEKMLRGDMYNPMDPELVLEREQARIKFQEINAMHEERKESRDLLFYDLLGKAGDGLFIEPPFYCDYGYNISVGDKVYMNFGCCILDVMPVRMGNNVMLGPNVQIYTATHPLEAKLRYSGREYAKPVTIGNDVWISGGAIICPGVSIGNGSVIGAGAVVTRDIPDNVFAGGNPAKVIKKIKNDS